MHPWNSQPLPMWQAQVSKEPPKSLRMMAEFASAAKMAESAKNEMLSKRLRWCHNFSVTFPPDAWCQIKRCGSIQEKMLCRWNLLYWGLLPLIFDKLWGCCVKGAAKAWTECGEWLNLINQTNKSRCRSSYFTCLMSIHVWEFSMEITIPHSFVRSD